MAVYLSNIVGTASIGVYSLATDKILIFPNLVPVRKAEKIAEFLKVKLVYTSINSSILIGAFVCANSNGLLLPHFTREEELKAIKSSFEGKITVMETRKTAYGNIVLANDHGAIVDHGLKKKEIKQISETLDVEVVPGEIAGLTYVGALAVATNNGVLVHPLLKGHERRLLEDVLNVPVDVGTVNCGIPYVRTGLICNTHAAIAGSMTTGPEMFIIESVLELL